MSRRAPLVLLVFAPLALGSCQQLDSKAGSEPVPPDFGSVPDPGDGTIPVQTMTPPILLDDGTSTTTDPCVSIKENAKLIRQQHCMSCHEGPSPQGKPLNFIMEDDQLANVATPSSNTQWTTLGITDYIKPGDPDHSLIYWRAAIEVDMPKKVSDTDMPNYTTLSDNSVLREWIANCMGASPAPPSSGGGGADGGASNPDGGSVGK